MSHARMVADDVGGNVSAVLQRIDAAARRGGRTGEDVRVLAATKYADVDTTRALVDAGVRDLAENRLPALVDKQAELAALGDAVTWHFIGRLQSRQAADVAARVSMLHSLSTASAVRRLDAFAATGAALPQLLVQVNVARDPAKDGVPPRELARFLDDLPESVAIAGLMTMPALAADALDSRPAFDELRVLAEQLRPRFAGRHPLTELSMGTSQDVEIAVECGATLVRLGRILYGRGESGV